MLVANTLSIICMVDAYKMLEKKDYKNNDFIILYIAISISNIISIDMVSKVFVIYAYDNVLIDYLASAYIVFLILFDSVLLFKYIFDR